MNTSKFKQLITQKLDQLHALQSEAQAGCETVALDQTRVGRLSRMDAMQSQAMNQAAQRRRELEIKRLDVALVSIENEDYGFCEECDEMISEGRLKFDLGATHCINCAQKLEQ